jgi:DNA-binding transcriptional LysR family regulator
MELRQLRSLVVLADERHFTRAAARLHIAQPALSQQLRRLEEELGLVLVDRTTRRVELTEAGQALVARARAALGELDAARAEMQERTGLLAGTVTIGTTQTPGPVDVPRLLAGFHREHPGIGLQLREGLSRSLVDDLRGDALELAVITDLEPTAMRGLDRHRLAEEPLVVVVPVDHRLASRARIPMRELRDERFVAFPEGATIRAIVGRAAGAAGFPPQIAFEAGEVSRVRAIVAEGLGVAVLPRSDAHAPGPAVHAVAVSDATFVHRVSVAWRADRRHAPGARRLLDLMRRPPVAG